MSIVLQNQQEVSHNSHINLSNIRLLDEFISIDFGFISNKKQNSYGSFIHVVAYDSKKNSKPISLGQKQLQNINFNEEKPYDLKISYKDTDKFKNFRVSVGVPNNPESHKAN